MTRAPPRNDACASSTAGHGLRRTNPLTVRWSADFIMQIGAMNHPGEPLAKEIKWMSDLALDFIDLTLEPPACATWQVQPDAIVKLLREHRLGVIGHTAYYLPIGSSFESLRRAAVEELKIAATAFAAIGAKWMNVHPDGHAPFTDEPTIVQRNIRSLEELVAFAKPLG